MLSSLFGHRKIEFDSIYLFGFAETLIHDFQNTILNSFWHCPRHG